MTLSWLNVFKHLLPDSKAWRLTIEKTLRQFFEGLGGLPADIKEYCDLVYLDLFPESTRELAAWEYQWGLPDTDLDEDQRRARLAATWAAIGGQSPRYIQDTLQDNDFDVYIHEWWVPATDPPEARDPRNWLIGVACLCGETLAECGEDSAACGERTPLGNSPYWLVNKIDIATRLYLCACGEAVAECGEADATAGEYDGFIILRKEYELPEDPLLWPYFLYFGGATFGEAALVNSARQGEFENLLLKICPAHLWIGLFIAYVDVIVEDETGYFLIDDGTGAFLA